MAGKNQPTAGGCRYVMAWGERCEEFHDIVDTTILELHNYDVPDHAFVMTTWHNDEALEGVFWFAQFCANFSYDDVQLDRSLVVHISRIDREADYLELFAQSETLPNREEDESSV